MLLHIHNKGGLQDLSYTPRSPQLPWLFLCSHSLWGIHAPGFRFPSRYFLAWLFATYCLARLTEQIFIIVLLLFGLNIDLFAKRLKTLEPDVYLVQVFGLIVPRSHVIWHVIWALEISIIRSCPKFEQDLLSADQTPPGSHPTLLPWAWYWACTPLWVSYLLSLLGRAISAS